MTASEDTALERAHDGAHISDWQAQGQGGASSAYESVKGLHLGVIYIYSTMNKPKESIHLLALQRSNTVMV